MRSLGSRDRRHPIGLAAMSAGSGIAIAGIWIAVAVVAYSDTLVGLIAACAAYSATQTIIEEDKP